jgi:hypothetical protein
MHPMARKGRIEIADAVMIDVALGVTESAGDHARLANAPRVKCGAPAWHLAEIDKINTTKLDARRWSTRQSGAAIPQS